MMEKESLDAFLRSYNRLESRFKAGQTVDHHALYDVVGEIEDALGQKQTAYLFEDDQFMSPMDQIGIYKHERFTRVPLHKHNYIELIYVWSGQYVQNINGKRVVCEIGDVCLLDTQTVHGVEVSDEDDVIINLIIRKSFFDVSFLNRIGEQSVLAEFLIGAVMTNHKEQNYLMFKTKDQPSFKELMTLMLCEYYNNQMGKQDVLASYMHIVLTSLLRTYLLPHDEMLCVSKKGRMILEVLAYIESHYRQCTLKDLSNQFNLSGKYLTSLLKIETGRSFIEHVHAHKISHAKALLRHSSGTIHEIIQACGYENEHFFYQKFKSFTGETPANYRKNRQ